MQNNSFKNCFYLLLRLWFKDSLKLFSLVPSQCLLVVGSVGNWGADHSLDKRCSMDHWSGDNGLDQRSGMDDGHRVNNRSADHSLDQRSRVHNGHRVDHGSSSIGAHNGSSMNHRSSGIGLHHWHLTHQIHIALVGDRRRGRGVHIGGLGEQTRSSGSDGQASEEGNLEKEKGC